MLSLPDFREKQIVMVFLSRGEKLSFKNDNIIITGIKNEIKHQSTCYRLFSVFVVGHLTVTTGLLQRAKKFGFSIVLMSHSLKTYGYWNAAAEGNVLLRKKQYIHNHTTDIAIKLIENKIHNQIRMLKNIRIKNSHVKKAISSLTSYKNRLRTGNITDKEILGLEGVASKVYFHILFKEYDWQARRPRAKIDITNCLLDIGYTLLFNFVEGLLELYGFDVYKGVYHKEFYQRKSLVCDLVEPFRPLIDYRLRKAYALNQIKHSDFTVSHGQYKIFGKKSLPYMAFFIEVLTLNKEEIFKYVQAYYRSFIRSKPVSQYPHFDINEIKKVA